MRIAFIGDLHYCDVKEENLEFKMKQVAHHKPDMAVMMGDFGGPRMHSVSGHEETKYLMDSIGCSWVGIMGNHDVEYNTEFMFDYSPEDTFKQVFGMEPYSATVVNGILLLCLTVSRQPLETLRATDSVYVSNSQYEWALEQLNKYKDMPTIMVTHPPIIGSGLRLSRPLLNTLSLDTFLDQTFNIKRWNELLKKFPQIKAWFSAHYHMGHDYDAAITQKDGVVHISCGVMTSCARDNSRNTRMIDITDNKMMKIYTLDHNNAQKLKLDATVDLTGVEAPCGRVSNVKFGEVLLGDDAPKKVWYSANLNRYFVATQKDLLWEYDCEFWGFTGLLALNKKVLELYENNDRIIMLYDDKIGSVDANSRMRWDWDEILNQELKIENEVYGNQLPTVKFSTYQTKEGLYIKFA